MSFLDKIAEKLELDGFDKRHKKAFVFLACVMVLVIVLWIWQLQNNIISPLYRGLNPKDLKKTAQSQQVVNTEADLKNKDTDKDALSDWDELNIYKTSPYLADSDSDGINDYEEIKKGTDPNCPAGQTCNNTTEQAQNQTTINPLDNPELINLLDQTTATTTTNPSTSNNSNNITDEEKNALKQIIGAINDPAVLREFLLSAGVDKTYVDSLKDEDLKKVINELLK